MTKNECYMLFECVMQVLKEQGTSFNGVEAGSCIWQALNAVKQLAEVAEIPLSETLLEGYDVDAIMLGKHPVTGEKRGVHGE